MSFVKQDDVLDHKLQSNLKDRDSLSSWTDNSSVTNSAVPMRRSQRGRKTICVDGNRNLGSYFVRNSLVNGSLSSANHSIIDEILPKSRIRSDTEISESPSSHLKRKRKSLPCDVPSSNGSCERKAKRRKTCVDEGNRTLDSFAFKTPSSRASGANVNRIVPRSQKQLHCVNVSTLSAKSGRNSRGRISDSSSLKKDEMILEENIPVSDRKFSCLLFILL